MWLLLLLPLLLIHGALLSAQTLSVCLRSSVYVFCITVGRGGGGGDQSVVQLQKRSREKSVKEERTRTQRQAHRYCLHIITLPYRLHLSAQRMRAPHMFT